MWGFLFEERTNLSFTIAAGPRQFSRISVRLAIIFYCLKFNISLLRLAGLRWWYSTPPPHGKLPILNWTLLDNHFARPDTKNTVSNNTPIVVGVFTDQLIRNDSPFIVACVFISAETYLPSRCLAINYFAFQTSCHNILLYAPVQYYFQVVVCMPHGT
jgi:hypothetical protein